MLKRVRELPAKANGRPRDGYAASDVREFLRNTIYDVAEVTHEGKDAKKIAVALRHYIKRNQEQCKGVGVAVRNGKAYLYRKGDAE